MNARALIRRGAFAEAAILLRKEIEDVEVRRGAQALQLVELLYAYAHALSRQRSWNVDSPEEEAALERALRIACQNHGNASVQAARVREALAVYLRSVGKIEAAVSHMEMVVLATESARGEGTVLGHALDGLAGMLLDVGRYTEAAQIYERALGMMGGRSSDAQRILMQFNHARALLLAGRPSDAASEFDCVHLWCVRKYGSEHRRTHEAQEWLERARMEVKRGNRT